MTTHRDYVEATPDDISTHEAFCRPGATAGARVTLDANGETGARLRESPVVPNGDVVVFDPDAIEKAMEEQLADMAWRLFDHGNYQRDSLSWRASMVYGGRLARPDFRITTTA